MPWLTPDSIPEDDDCRPLSIPADSVWLALVSGALTELTQKYNWQKFGTLTVDETVAKMQEIVNGYYTDPCAACTTEGGYRVTRISPSGHFEQLDDAGNWVDGTDEYHIPPPEARTDGTPPDQNCLAAKNAVNVLEQLYENLTDSWNSDLDDAEAITAFILGAIALVGFEFAPITWSIVAFMTPVFTLLYTALEFIGADLWDEAVSNQITCFLLDCVVNTDGVVTFDWDCFMLKLQSPLDTFGLTEEQLRLYLQIAYMLYFIGGVDGLNLAGRTTEITDDDCAMCDEHWCWKTDATSDFGDWTAESWPGTSFPPSWDGDFWNSGEAPPRVSYVWVSREFTPSTVTDAALVNSLGVTGSIWINGDGSLFSGTKIWESGTYIGGTYSDVERFDLIISTVDAGMPPFVLEYAQFAGDGDNPFGLDNC